jgi:CRISPR/Cas system-associated exonuclease Cas4 (RecB family)
MPLLTIADLNQPREALHPYIQRAQALTDMYYRHIAEEQNDTFEYSVQIFGTSGRSRGIHASEISKCMRQIVYCIMGVERQPPIQGADVNMLMRFRLGTAIHAMIQNDWHRIAAKSGGLLHFQDEVRVNPDIGGLAQLWNIYSSCDGIFTLCDQVGQPEVRVGLEIKSISDDGFNKLKSPQADHLEQTTVYMATLNLPLMWIIYYNKSNSNFTSSYSPWLYIFDSEKWSNDLEIRFARCTHMAQVGELPDRTEGMHCKWCSFSYTCGPKTLQLRTASSPRLSQGMRRR